MDNTSHKCGNHRRFNQTNPFNFQKLRKTDPCILTNSKPMQTLDNVIEKMYALNDWHLLVLLFLYLMLDYLLGSGSANSSSKTNRLISLIIINIWSMLIEKATDEYKESKHSVQDQIYNSTTLYPTLLINKSKE